MEPMIKQRTDNLDPRTVYIFSGHK